MSDKCSKCGEPISRGVWFLGMGLGGLIAALIDCVVLLLCDRYLELRVMPPVATHIGAVSVGFVILWITIAIARWQNRWDAMVEKLHPSVRELLDLIKMNDRADKYSDGTISDWCAAHDPREIKIPRRLANKLALSKARKSMQAREKLSRFVDPFET